MHHMLDIKSDIAHTIDIFIKKNKKCKLFVLNRIANHPMLMKYYKYLKRKMYT